MDPWYAAGRRRRPVSDPAVNHHLERIGRALLELQKSSASMARSLERIADTLDPPAGDPNAKRPAENEPVQRRPQEEV